MGSLTTVGKLQRQFKMYCEPLIIYSAAGNGFEESYAIYSFTHSLFSFFNKIKHAIDKCKGMNRVAGYVQINFIFC